VDTWQDLQHGGARANELAVACGVPSLRPLRPHPLQARAWRPHLLGSWAGVDAVHTRAIHRQGRRGLNGVRVHFRPTTGLAFYDSYLCHTRLIFAMLQLHPLSPPVRAGRHVFLRQRAHERPLEVRRGRSLLAVLSRWASRTSSRR
jgi:hypothetical protein